MSNHNSNDGDTNEISKVPEGRLTKVNGDECSDRDLMISRVVDGRAGSREWFAIESLAAADASIWRELAMSQRDQRALEILVSSAGAVAESAGLPSSFEHEPVRVEFSRRRTGSWTGWAAAAAILLAYVAGVPLNGPRLNVPGVGMGKNNEAGLLPAIPTADEALATYLATGKKEGSVLGEIPDKLLVKATPGMNGRFQVIYIRQIVEVHQVDNLLHFPSSRDEQGNIISKPVPVILRTSQAY